MLSEFTKKIHKKNVSRVLKKKQEEVDKLYAEEGLSDNVLAKQVEINRIRNEENITDESHMIHETYVQ